jgi:hypothetical protein
MVVQQRSNRVSARPEGHMRKHECVALVGGHLMVIQASADSPPMFANRFIDLFSRTHAASVPILFIPAVLLWTYWSLTEVGIGWSATLFPAGAVLWTLTEYWLHRTFFHWQPRASWGPRLHFFVHGVHFTPKHRWLRALRRHHMFHHFKKGCEARKFGVSTPFWDWVFRTL